MIDDVIDICETCRLPRGQCRGYDLCLVDGIEARDEEIATLKGLRDELAPRRHATEEAHTCEDRAKWIAERLRADEADGLRLVEGLLALRDAHLHPTKGCRTTAIGLLVDDLRMLGRDRAVAITRAETAEQQALENAGLIREQVELRAKVEAERDAAMARHIECESHFRPVAARVSELQSDLDAATKERDAALARVERLRDVLEVLPSELANSNHGGISQALILIDVVLKETE